MTDLDLPNPGPDRFFYGRHQPQRKTTPLRLELREQINKGSDRLIPSMSRLIAFDDVVALPPAIREAAEKILSRAGRVDEFVGILSTHHQEESPDA